ncbi:MAG: FkbM family methyltransferase [Holophagales bacterium]|nr:FkbM family methyltransferase [Holophagales bacterium]
MLSRFAFDGIVDGGANVGEFAHLVRQTLPKADLVCVEPHPHCAAILRRNGFRVVEAALWREPGRLRLFQPLSATTSCTVVGSRWLPVLASPRGTSRRSGWTTSP